MTHAELVAPSFHPFATGLFDAEPLITPQGHALHPVIDNRPTGNAPGLDQAAAGLTVGQGFAAHPHWHRHSVLVYVVRCGPEGVATRFGPNLEVEVIQHQGQLLPVPKRCAHIVINLSLDVEVQALEIRVELEDNHLLPELNDRAETLRVDRLLQRHGHDRFAAFQASPAGLRAARLDTRQESACVVGDVR